MAMLLLKLFQLIAKVPGVKAGMMLASRTEPLVQGPRELKPGAPHALLVLVPGALLGPGDYLALLKALQDHDAGMNLWVASPPIVWPMMMALGFEDTSKWAEHGDAQMQRAIDAAVAAGFQLESTPAGRMENVIVAMHSIAGAFCGSLPMQRCGGAVMMGAALDGTVCGTMTAATAPRPLLHIFGQLDGQLRLPRAAWAAAAAAHMATQLGARTFALQRPFAVVPGLNHASMSNGRVNVQRGDLPADEPIEKHAEALAELIVAFVAAHHPSSTPRAVEASADKLLHATQAAFQLLNPFAEAAGRGSPAALLEGDAHTAAAAAHAYGAERLPLGSRAVGSLLHPGEAAAAEAFARQAQRRMLAAGMPAGASQGVRVAVTVHPCVQSFIYSQPTVFEAQTRAGAAEWVVHCHVYLHWEYYQPGWASMRSPMSPLYSLKLKKGGAVAQAMGLQGGGEGVVSGAELNEATLAAALEAAPQLLLDTYRRRGKPLSFAPDRDLTPTMRTPLEWVHGPVKVEAGEGGMVLTSPCLSTPLGRPPYDCGPGRMMGCHYIKACSPAWMHEWVMVEGLRHGDTRT